MSGPTLVLKAFGGLTIAAVDAVSNAAEVIEAVNARKGAGARRVMDPATRAQYAHHLMGSWLRMEATLHGAVLDVESRAREVELPAGALGLVFENGSTQVKQVREGSALRGLVHPGERIVAFAHAGGRVDCTSGWESTDAGLAALLNTHKDEPGRRLTVRGNAAHSGAQPASMLRHFLS